MSRVVADIDLLARLADHPDVGRVPVFALLRVGGIPVGSAELGCSSGAMPADSLAAGISIAHADRTLRLALTTWLQVPGRAEAFRLDEALEELQASTRAPGSAATEFHPAVAVVICTRDRPQHLDRALGAIVPFLDDGDELLVVENGSHTHALNAPVRERYPRVRFVGEERPGLAWARNRALVETRAPVILFTDDDCVPDPQWIGAHRSAFGRNPDLDLATGLIEPLEMATPAQALFERYGGFPRNYDRRWIFAPPLASIAREVGHVAGLGAGANMAVRRRLIERAGHFDAALGPGTETGAGDDVEFLFRALKSGALLACEPRAMVRHEHRRDDAALETQIEGWSRGYACAIERSSLAFPEERSAYRILQARIALLFHARRAVFSPGIRRLAVAELRGMRGAARRYASSRLAAEQIARTVASLAPDASPVAGGLLGRSPVQKPDSRVSRCVDVGALSSAIDVGAGVERATVTIERHGVRLGQVDLPVFRGVVGLDRLLDHVIDRLGATLVGGDWDASVRSVHRSLVDTVRSTDVRLPRGRG